MKFPYLKFPSDPANQALFPGKRDSLRPVIPIRLVYKDRESPLYHALVDSGADYCIFHASIGEYLGIEVERGGLLEYTGIEGDNKKKAFFHNILINMGGFKFNAYVGFSFDLEKMPYGVLGQVGFFDLFKVDFDYNSCDLEIKEKRGVTESRKK